MKKLLLTGIAALFLWQTGTVHAEEDELSKRPECWTPKEHYVCLTKLECKAAWQTEMANREHKGPRFANDHNRPECRNRPRWR
jgi:hypothetical protein